MKNRILLTILALAGLATCAIPGGAQNNPPFPPGNTTSITAQGANAQSNPVGAGSTCSADISGTWTGTLTFQVIGQSNNAQSATAYTYTGTKQGSTTTTNGMYYWAAAGASYCNINAGTFVSGTAVITMVPSVGAFPAPGAISSIGPITLVTPVTVNCASPACTVTTPAPATTVSPGLFIGVTNACPSTAPANINGAYTCTNDSTGRLQVSTPVPYATANASFPPSSLETKVYGAAGVQIPGVAVGCNKSFTFATSSATATWILIQASTTGSSIYFCGYSVVQGAATAATLNSSVSNSCTPLVSVMDLSGTASAPTQGLADSWFGIGGPQPFLGLAACYNVTAITSGSTLKMTFFYGIMSPGP